MGLKKTILETIKGTYNVEEQYKFNFEALRFPNNKKRNIVVVNSFDGVLTKVTGATLSLRVFALKESTKPDDIAKNYYLEEDYQVASTHRDKLSAPFLRTEVESMIKGSEKVYKE